MGVSVSPSQIQMASYKNGYRKRTLSSRTNSAIKGQSSNLQMESKSNINGSVEEITVCGTFIPAGRSKSWWCTAELGGSKLVPQARNGKRGRAGEKEQPEVFYTPELTGRCGANGWKLSTG